MFFNKLFLASSSFVSQKLAEVQEKGIEIEVTIIRLNEHVNRYQNFGISNAKEIIVMFL